MIRAILHSLLLMLAFPVCGIAALDELSFADRVVCDSQLASGTSLRRVTWRQGTTPLMGLYLLRGGKPSAFTAGSVTSRLVCGASSTSAPYATATNYAVTSGVYLVQMPTIGTNTGAAVWWYSVYFDYAGRVHWAGSGELVITAGGQ